MTPRFHIQLANSLMLLGAVSVPLGMVRFLSQVSPAPHRMSLLGDGLLNLGALLAFALITGLIGFIWSLVAEKRNPSVRVGGTNAIRILVLIVVFAPLVFGLS